MATSMRFIEAIRRAESGTLDLMGLITAADGLVADGDSELTPILYKFWLLANPTHALWHIPAFNCGSQLLQRGDLQGAKEFLGRAVAYSPDFYPARLNLASVFERMGAADQAVVELQQINERLAQITASNIGSKVQACRSIARLQRSTEVAEKVLRQSIEVDPSQRELVQHWVNGRQGRFVWPSLEPVGTLSVRDIQAMMAPLSISSYVDDPLMHLDAGRSYTQQMVSKMPCSTVGDWLPPADPHAPKLKIAYLSSDFCQHAVGYLMLDVFDYHNRARYEITVLNISPRTDDPIQQKIMSQVDRWVDLYGVDDKLAAKRIVDLGIDILLDMNGHTNYQRTRLLAMRPAPIIVNWLGYPGTMGSEDHHYMIADDFIVPPAYEKYYSEKVLRLPCYQPNGKLYPVPPVQGTRADFGLPEDAVVFCCFNGSVKVTPAMFSRWMTILAQVPRSVLWLRGCGEEGEKRLRIEALRRGVDGARLVFLPFRSNTEYLGCHRFADIFLDTFPYGAHTTASDSLRMGVPIVTIAGLGFASRVCASLSRAAGMPDTICATPEQYVRMAIELGNDPQKRQDIRRRLAEALPGCVLFDSRLLVQHLEGLFETMWSDYCGGTLPRPAMPDAGSCREIGVGVDRQTRDVLSQAEYDRLQKLRQAYVASR